MRGDPEGTWQERVDWIDAMIQRYVELARTLKSQEENEAELEAIGEAIPYDGELDKSALKKWRELVKLWQNGWPTEYEEEVNLLEAPWIDVLNKYRLDDSLGR